MDTLEAAGKPALWVFEAIEYCRHRYGPAAVGSYVVSMARDVDDILTVLLLARWAGFAETQTDTLPLDVAPLFESVESLERRGRDRRPAARRPDLPRPPETRGGGRPS